MNNLYIYASGTVEILGWDGETIYMESHGKAVWLDGFDGTLTISDKKNSWLYNDPVTKISIPSGYLLDELKLHETETVIGDELRADTVMIDENIADVTIESLLYARMELEVNANGGNVTIEKVAYTPTAVLDRNAGNIHVTFEGKRSDYDISTFSMQGTITVDGVQVDNSPFYGSGQIRANSNTGNIDIGFTQ